MKIFVWIDLQSQEQELLKQKSHPYKLTFAKDIPEAERKKYFLEADIAFGNVPADWLTETTRLLWLQLESVGFGEYQSVASASDVQITNLKGMFSIPVAETAVAGILTLFRGMDTLIRLKEQRRWMKNEVRASLRTLNGASAVIVGGGAIGSVIKDRLQAFGVKVMTMSKTTPGADMYSLAALDEQLPGADIVISCLPETQETIGFFDHYRLSLFAAAVFVNVGRGSVVDETALMEQLSAGQLAGCVLDVTHEEPLPEHHPLWACPHTIITQHTGGGGSDELLNKVKLFLANLERFRQGQPLENVVNLKRSY